MDAENHSWSWHGRSGRFIKKEESRGNSPYIDAVCCPDWIARRIDHPAAANWLPGNYA